MLIGSTQLLLLPRPQAEVHLLKVVVEAEGIPQLVLLHHDETGAVGEGEVFVVILLEHRPGCVPDDLVNPNYPNILRLQNPDAEVFSRLVIGALFQISQCLVNHVIRGYEPRTLPG